LASGGDDARIRLWNLETDKQRMELSGHARGAIAAVAVSPDGELLATAGKDNQIIFWETTTGKQRGPEPIKTQTELTAVAFTPDGRTLVSAGRDDHLTLWEVATTKKRATIPAQRFGIHQIAIAADGRLLAAAGVHSSVRLYDLFDLKEVAQLEGHQGELRAAAFSANGEFLVTGGDDRSAIVWNVSPVAARLSPTIQASSDEHLAELFKQLENQDAAVGFAAVRDLRGCPDKAILLLDREIKRISRADFERIETWFKELESDDFEVREKASEELYKVGDIAEPLIRKALTGKLPSLETRRRLERFLERREKEFGKAPFPSQLRALRGLEVLEGIGNTDAAKVVARLAGGAPGAWLTIEAKQTLERMHRRLNKKP
jgi:hypothetical protein